MKRYAISFGTDDVCHVGTVDSDVESDELLRHMESVGRDELRALLPKPYAWVDAAHSEQNYAVFNRRATARRVRAILSAGSTRAYVIIELGEGTREVRPVSHWEVVQFSREWGSKGPRKEVAVWNRFPLRAQARASRDERNEIVRQNVGPAMFDHKYRVRPVYANNGG